ncbi:MAG: sigma-70 family RNA polymerase sigma factor [Bacteroidota bacterium]
MIKNRDTNSDNKSLSDWDIIQKVLKGDSSLLEVLYDRYSGKVYYKCLSITHDQEISKDLAHDVMIKIFMNLSKFKGTSDFSFWVKSITYNYCMDYLKKKKRLNFDEFESADFEQVPVDEIELQHKMLKEVQLEQLEALLEELKGNDRMILLMRYQDGMSIKQIAGTLKVSVSAVKMRLKRSRDRLAELLKASQNG